MFLKEVHIKEFKALKDLHISLEQNAKSNVFSVASLNGLGKSTLLQFIFIMLHGSFNQRRNKYVSNMLAGLYPDILEDEQLELAQFVIEDEAESINIDFIIVSNNYGSYNFDCFLDIPEIEQQLSELEGIDTGLNSLLTIQEEIKNFDRVSVINMREIKSHVKSRHEHKMYKFSEARDDYGNLIDAIITRMYSEKDKENELYELLNSLQHDQQLIIHHLTDKGLSYALHIDNQNVLLVRSTKEMEYLSQLSNKIFLIAPNTQVFLFLERESRKEIVNDYRQYYEYIRDAREDLNGFFNYDFSSADLIAEALRKAIAKDSECAIETGQYGNNLQNIQQELNDFLVGKEICANKDLSQVNFKLKQSDQELLPEDLSHGELKKLGLYVLLKSHVENDSLVLMDEVDIGLHPKWQYELHDNLQAWSPESQFILATHSPQIISSTHYKNLILLVKEESGICVRRYNKAPLDRDINTIIKEIMGAGYMPQELQKLQDEYRELFDQGKEESEEAKQLKQDILEYESEGSAFFQGISFDKELRE